MMPSMDGFETCRRIKADPATSHIPVVLVTALDGREDRIVGLDAGADDFVAKPIDDVLLFARVRSLTRLKLIMDELREREESSRRLGVSADKAGKLKRSGGRILIVDDNARQAASPPGRQDGRGAVQGTPTGRRERPDGGVGGSPGPERPPYRQRRRFRVRRSAPGGPGSLD
jgi:chemotaxis response regulator CheB